MPRQLQPFFKEDALTSLRDLFRVHPSDASHQIAGKRIATLLVPLLLAGLAAGGVAFVGGHHTLGTTSEMPWGVLIATYFFCAVSSTGLYLISALGHVFGIEAFKPMAKKAVFLALVILLFGFFVIATELERPLLLMKLAILSPNPASSIWWMGTLYAMYLTFISIQLVFMFRNDERRARVLGILGFIAAIAADSNLGGVFGQLHGRPYWYGAFLPIYSLASALVCGTALMVLIVWFTDYFGGGRTVRAENADLLRTLGNMLAGLVATLLIFTVWKSLHGAAGGHYHKSDVTLAFLTGPLFLSFWLFEVLIGMVVPLTLLLSGRRRQPRCIALAAGLLMTGVFVMRYNLVFAGQMFSLKPVAGHLGEVVQYGPPFKGNVAGFLSYSPSIVEVLIVAGAIAGAILLYTVGHRVLKLEPEA